MFESPGIADKIDSQDRSEQIRESEEDLIAEVAGPVVSDEATATGRFVELIEVTFTNLINLF